MAGCRVALTAVLAIAVCAGVLAATPVLSPVAEPLQALFRYERYAVLHGEWWRLITAHLLHLGPAHLAMNVAGLLCVLWLCRPVMSAGQTLICLLLYAPAVSLGLLIFNPGLGWYVGLSGVLHGLLVTAACLLLRTRPEAFLLLTGVLAKLVFEQSGAGQVWSMEWLAGPVIVDAHLYGVCAGLCGALFLHVAGAARQPAPKSVLHHA